MNQSVQGRCSLTGVVLISQVEDHGSSLAVVADIPVRGMPNRAGDIMDMDSVDAEVASPQELH